MLREEDVAVKLLDKVAIEELLFSILVLKLLESFTYDPEKDVYEAEVLIKLLDKVAIEELLFSILVLNEAEDAR